MNTNTRYIPEHSQPITRAGLPAIVYTYTAKDGKPAAIAYQGKSNKNTWHYRFLTAEQQTRRIDQFFNDVAEREDMKNARKAFTHGYKVGDILYSSWGYDQTNIEFYQVTATTTKTITFREIGQIRSGKTPMGDSWETLPNVGKFSTDSKPYTRTVKPGYRKDKGQVSFAEYEGGYMKTLSAHDGRPLYASDGH